MTAHKHLKQLVRARMEKTGERYTTARRHVLGIGSVSAEPAATPSPSSPPFHFPGNVAATTALRAIVTHAGLRAPHTDTPFSEAMLFGIAGGIGIGLFTFYYEKADVASFYVAGRHHWHDDQRYLADALDALGFETVVQETAGAKTAAKQLADAVSGGRPVIAWVDMASLPHRGMPESMRGGAYHVVTVYDVDEAKGTALIGDLSDQPFTIALNDLSAARARIAKQKFRLMAIAPTKSAKKASGAPATLKGLNALVNSGLKRAADGLVEPALRQAPANARLEVLEKWADRLVAVKGPDRWEHIFKPGVNQWRGLNNIYTFIESYGTGGGLCRPLFADFLDESATALDRPALRDLASRYRQIGQRWSDLADAALPDNVPVFRKSRALRERLAEIRHDGGPADEARAVWQQLESLEQDAAVRPPLDANAWQTLRADLATRVRALHEAEVAALKALQKV